MAEIGEIVEINNSMAIAKLTRVEACSKCKACTVGMTEQEMLLTGKGNDLKIGDMVEITLSTNKMLTAVYVLYGIPLLAMLGGFALGVILKMPEIAVFFVGIIALFISYFLIKLFDKNRNKDDYMPHFNKI